MFLNCFLFIYTSLNNSVINKKSIQWWNTTGVEICKNTYKNYNNFQWKRNYCEDYIHGNPFMNIKHKNLKIVKIGLNDGKSVISYVKNGYTVISIEANSKNINNIMKRPAIRYAIDKKWLMIINRAIVSPFYNKNIATLYKNKKNRQTSLFLNVEDSKNYKEVYVKTIVCSKVLKLLGAVYYLDINTGKADEYCIQSLESSNLPYYISTHNSSHMEVLSKLTYKKFITVSKNSRDYNKLPEYIFKKYDSSTLSNSILKTQNDDVLLYGRQ